MAEVLDALLESVADAIYLVGADGRVRFINPAGLAMLGYDAADELIGRDSHATIHHSHPDGTPFPESECPLLHARSAGEPIRVDHDWFVRRDGSMVPVGYASAPFATEQGSGAVVVFRDITQQLESEAALARAAASQARAEELAASRARIVAAAAEERRRIARDIHDGAQQRLIHARLRIEEARRALRADAADTPGAAAARGAAGSRAADTARRPDSLGAADSRRAADSPRAADSAGVALDAAVEELQRAVRDLRALAAGIHPAVLTDRGLAAAIEDLTADATLPVALDLAEGRWPADVEAAAYFVASEALTNVAKHAEADSARVSVTVTGGALVVGVADDGRGGADPLRGSGLRGLADRVAALGGTFEVDSGAGTTVRATFPLA